MSSEVEAGAVAVDGFAAIAEDDLARGRLRLEMAANLYERSGLPFEAAATRVALAGTLRRMGCTDAAVTQAALAADCLRDVGATTAADRAAALMQPDTKGEGGRRIGGLSSREIEVLALLVDGSSDQEIATRLTISRHTVHRHVSNILAKLCLHSRTAAATYAVRHGIGGNGNLAG